MTIDRFRAVSEAQLDRLPQLAGLEAEQRRAIRVVSQVLPFRVNEHVVNTLIDWSKVPDDPVFRLTFPQRGMLADADFDRIAALLDAGAPRARVRQAADAIRATLNPHPAGQLELNVPTVAGRRLRGVQHKYAQTVLFFPAQGQTCHAYCTFCFRWAQFIGDRELQFASADVEQLQTYLAGHPEVTDLLITGGDPMVMNTRRIERWLDAVLRPELAHVQSIRFGSKALTWWPQRFVSDPDADALLRAFERVVRAGKHLAFMAHLNHWREIDNPVAQQAIPRIRATGAVIRSQAPILAGVNDDADAWARTWSEQVRLGIVPYYAFVVRDTGARRTFEVPLARASAVISGAIRQVSGLARTVRGPSMSAEPGKVAITGVAEVSGQRVFVLELLQARRPELVGRPFFARYDPRAVWLDELEPAFADRFPFDG